MLLFTTLTTFSLSFLVVQLPSVAYFFGVRPSQKDSATMPGVRFRGMAPIFVLAIAVILTYASVTIYLGDDEDDRYEEWY